MKIELKKTTYQGDLCYTWTDENGKKWRVYKSFGLWRYIREDHDVSSIGYLTMGDATVALEKAWEGAQ